MHRPPSTPICAALLEQGLTAEAVQQERTALWLDPELVQAHVLLGRALARQGRHPEAAAAFAPPWTELPRSPIRQANSVAGSRLTRSPEPHSPGLFMGTASGRSVFDTSPTRKRG